jgi:hypothetical protein
MPLHTLVAVFHSASSAEDAQSALLEHGIARHRVSLSADMTSDPIAGEAPGQSYENQPGQPADESATAKYGDAVRMGACVLSVDASSRAECADIERLLRHKRGLIRTFPYRAGV